MRQAKYEELERIIWDEDAELWLYYTVAIYGVSDRLRNSRRAATTTSS